jgi:hypothetical protein
MVDLSLDRMQRQEPPQLVERHALLQQYRTREDGLGPLVEDVVLGEGAVGRVFRACGGRNAERVKDCDHASDATVGLGLLGDEVSAERNIGVERIAMPEQLFALGRAEVDQALRKREVLGSSLAAHKPECNGDRQDDAGEHGHLPQILFGRQHGFAGAARQLFAAANRVGALWITSVLTIVA